MDTISGKDPLGARKKNESAVVAQLELDITEGNMVYHCRKLGIDVPAGTDYLSFFDWIEGYVSAMPDSDLIALMKKLGLSTSPMTDSWDGVFVVHSSRDGRFANGLVKALNCINVPDSDIYCSSVDETSTRIGDSFVDIIHRSLTGSKLVVCILSEDSVRSTYCLQEMGAALILKKPIVPVLVNGLDPTLMPGFMDNTRYQAADADTYEHAVSLLESVLKAVDGECTKSDIDKGSRLLMNYD